MFGMNAKDAQAGFEDVTRILLANQAADDAQDRQLRAQSVGANIDRMARGLKVRDDMIQRQRQEFDKLQWDRNKEVVIASALEATLAQAIADVAKLSGKSVEEMKQRYNTLRTVNYNNAVNAAIASVKGAFKVDPRVELPPKDQQWYVPGLDTDHGF